MTQMAEKTSANAKSNLCFLKTLVQFLVVLINPNILTEGKLNDSNCP